MFILFKYIFKRFELEKKVRSNGNIFKIFMTLHTKLKYVDNENKNL